MTGNRKNKSILRTCNVHTHYLYTKICMLEEKNYMCYYWIRFFSSIEIVFRQSLNISFCSKSLARDRKRNIHCPTDNLILHRKVCSTVEMNLSHHFWWFSAILYCQLIFSRCLFVGQQYKQTVDCWLVSKYWKRIDWSCCINNNNE